MARRYGRPPRVKGRTPRALRSQRHRPYVQPEAADTGADGEGVMPPISLNALPYEFLRICQGRLAAHGLPSLHELASAQLAVSPRVRICELASV